MTEVLILYCSNISRTKDGRLKPVFLQIVTQDDIKNATKEDFNNGLKFRLLFLFNSLIGWLEHSSHSKINIKL